VKNAPAVTARRATNQIVLGPVQQVLAGAGTETATQTAAPAVRETQTEAPAAIVVAELNVRVATTPRIAPAEMATDHTRLAHRATGIDPILRAPLVTAKPARAATAIVARRVLAEIDHTQRAPLVTAIRVHPEVMVIALTRRALLVMVIARIRRAPRVMEIDRIRRALRGTAIRDRPAAVAIVPTLLVLLAMAIPVPVAMAMTAHVFPAATAIQVAGLLGAMAIRLVDRPGPAETDPIRHALLVTVRDQSVLVSIGLTVLARTDRIGRVPIVPMATSRVASGNRMGESVVRSARR
jgi:hypothetical protein